MNTGRLAREGVSEFMFVLGQARIKGTVRMITPETTGDGLDL